LLQRIWIPIKFPSPVHLLIGTDYAHPIGGPDKAVGFVKALELTDAQCEKILWKNAARLFNLDL